MLASYPPIIPVLRTFLALNCCLSFDHSSNHSKPKIAIYLKDLLFSHDGNKTFINKLVNFNKFKLIANQIRQIIALASVPYDKSPVSQKKELAEYIQNPPVIRNRDQLSNMSAKLEQWPPLLDPRFVAFARLNLLDCFDFLDNFLRCYKFLDRKRRQRKKERKGKKEKGKKEKRERKVFQFSTHESICHCRREEGKGRLLEN